MLDLLALLDEGILDLLRSGALKTTLDGGPDLRSEARGGTETEALGNHFVFFLIRCSRIWTGIQDGVMLFRSIDVKRSSR